MSDITEKGGTSQTILKVVGVGGAGINAVNAMIEAKVQGVEFICVSISPKRLRFSKAPIQLMIGSDPRGLSTGGNLDSARQAVAQHKQALAEILHDADMVFIAAGMGSGTGTGATPMIAQIARECGALVVGVVTTPFRYEGKKRMSIAQSGIDELALHTDCLIVISNEQLVSISEKGTPLLDAFKPADEILRQAIQGIAELITSSGRINADFNDVRTVMLERGATMIGMGTARGENRAVEASTKAVKTPLMMETDLQGARGLIINITASEDMTLEEFDTVTKFFHDRVAAEANIIIGLVIDEEMKGQIKVTVIATGLSGRLSASSK